MRRTTRTGVSETPLRPLPLRVLWQRSSVLVLGDWSAMAKGITSPDVGPTQREHRCRRYRVGRHWRAVQTQPGTVSATFASEVLRCH